MSVDGPQGAADLGWGGDVLAGHERVEDLVADLGVEDSEQLPVAGEVVGGGVRPADDEPVTAEPGQVVAGPGHWVGLAEQSGHPGAQALVRDAGDGEAQHGQRAGQGLDPRVAEPQGRRPSAILGEGGLCDPLKGWTRKAASALADTYSLHQPGVAVTGSSLQFGQVVQAAPAAQVSSVVANRFHPDGAVFLQVALDPRVAEREVHGDLVGAVQQPGTERAGRPGGDLAAEDDLDVLGTAQVHVPGQQLLEAGPGPA